MARPNICRLMSFRRLICPSMRPLLQDSWRAARSASRSAARPWVKLRGAVADAASSQAARDLVLCRRRSLPNSLMRSATSRMPGTTARTVSTNRRSALFSVVGSLVSRRAVNKHEIRGSSKFCVDHRSVFHSSMFASGVGKCLGSAVSVLADYHRTTPSPVSCGSSGLSSCANIFVQ